MRREETTDELRKRDQLDDHARDDEAQCTVQLPADRGNRADRVEDADHRE
jgi:hypothetical protein